MVFLWLSTPPWLAASELEGQARQSISKAVDFLLQAQQPDGAFRSYFCVDAALSQCMPTTATTPTAIVLAGLAAVSDPRTAAPAENGGRFLLSQMDAEGFFSYFSRTDPQYATQPAELGVTCFVRTVLETLGFSLPPILQKLREYQTPEGRFHNFGIPPAEAEAIKADGTTQQRHLVVDPAINAWVFTYFVRHGQAPAALCEYFVHSATEEDALAVPVIIESPYLFPYALSQAYRHGATCLEPAKAAWQPRLLRQQRPDGSWGNVIETALAASSLMYFGYAGDALDRAIQSLLKAQQPNGSWRRAVLRAHELKPVWHVSEEMSTGYALEALGTYLMVRRAEPG